MAATPAVPVHRLSLDMVVKSLYQGKSITVTGTVYYRVQGGQLVTHLVTPIMQITMANAVGEFKTFDPKQNQVMLMQGAEFSSQNSFIYSFLSGKTNDLGLGEFGFKMTGSRREGNLNINTYRALPEKQTIAPVAEIAFENYLPIYLGFKSENLEPQHETYYTNYQQVGHMRLPFTVTEVEHFDDGDSSIVRRTYSNLKLNEAVPLEWLDFKIPSSAKITTMPAGNSASPK